VFGILARLRKIGIRILQHWVLVAVAQLVLEASVARSLMIFGFFGALTGILIGMVLVHHSTSRDEFGEFRLLVVDAPRQASLFFAFSE
jgi:hypothetical protein